MQPASVRKILRQQKIKFTSVKRSAEGSTVCLSFTDVESVVAVEEYATMVAGAVGFDRVRSFETKDAGFSRTYRIEVV